MNEPNENRMGTLIVELLGAQQMATLIERVLNDASPEQKKRLADAVFERAIEEVKLGRHGHDMRRGVEAEIRDVIRQALEPHRETIAAQATASIREITAEVMTPRVEALIKEGVRAALDQMRSKAY